MKRKLTAVIILTTVIGLASAADTSGKITGVVMDPAGNLIPGSSVTLTNKSTGVKRASPADSQGVFAFPVVPVGTYDLIVTIDKFQPYKKSNIAIDVGSALQLDITLELAGMSQS